MAHPTREAQSPSPTHALPTCEGPRTTDVRVQPTERARSPAPRQPSHSPGGTARINCDALRQKNSEATATTPGEPDYC